MFYLLSSGSKKSSALDRVIEALAAVEEEFAPVSSSQDDIVLPDGNTPQSQASQAVLRKTGFSIFRSNETITMAKLHDTLLHNQGCYLSLADEMEWMFDALDGKARHDSLDRQIWLSLYGGGSWSRASRASQKTLSSTRLNYTGKYEFLIKGQKIDLFTFENETIHHHIWSKLRRNLYIQFHTHSIEKILHIVASRGIHIDTACLVLSLMNLVLEAQCGNDDHWVHVVAGEKPGAEQEIEMEIHHRHSILYRS